MHYCFTASNITLFIICFNQVNSNTYKDVDDVYKLITKTSRAIKPRFHQNETVDVEIYSSINALQDYDEISGILTFTGSFTFMWNDEFKTWDPNQYGGVSSAKIPAQKTWIPSVLLRNGVETNSLFTYVNKMELEVATVTYFPDGAALFNIVGQYHVTCDSDVTSYPFDEHQCIITLLTADPMKDLKLTSMPPNLDFVLPNAEWIIKPNSSDMTKGRVVFTFGHFHSVQDTIDISFVIKREFLFPLLNIVLPIVFLSMAHVLVFALPVESGERTSFAFTLLLTLTVFMSMVSDRLPPSSSISILNAFLLQQIVLSVLTTSFVVLSIRIFYKETQEKIGAGYKCILFLFLCFKRVSDKNTSTKYDNKDCTETNRIPNNKPQISNTRESLDEILNKNPNANETDKCDENVKNGVGARVRLEHTHDIQTNLEKNLDNQTEYNCNFDADPDAKVADITWKCLASFVDKLCFWIIFLVVSLQLIIYTICMYIYS